MSDEQPADTPADGQERQPDWAHSFGGVAEAYERGRPTYPVEAVRWMLGDQPRTVLELGAGTGKLTRALSELGHDVHATDPDAAMLRILERAVPGVRTAQASAEEVPLADASVDVVVAAQAFHWFDLDRALPEAARVLRPGGRLCAVWNTRNEKIPWVRRLGALIGTQEQLRDPAEALALSELFRSVEDREFSHWQTIDRQSIQDLVLSRSNVAVLDERERAAKLAEVLAFYDEFGRGMDGMQLPYVTRCYRADVVERPGAATSDADGEDVGTDTDPPGEKGESHEETSCQRRARGRLGGTRRSRRSDKRQFRIYNDSSSDADARRARFDGDAAADRRGHRGTRVPLRGDSGRDRVPDEGAQARALREPRDLAGPVPVRAFGAHRGDLTERLRQRAAEPSRTRPADRRDPLR